MANKEMSLRMYKNGDEWKSRSFEKPENINYDDWKLLVDEYIEADKNNELLNLKNKYLSVQSSLYIVFKSIINSPGVWKRQTINECWYQIIKCEYVLDLFENDEEGGE